jgi:prepilin-type N-terminal cleavage/methylation domain-containing protein
MSKRFYKIFADVRGFTLMEILVSMLILSIVAVLILQGLRLGYKVWEKGESKIAYQQRMRVAFDTISKQLSSVYSFSVKEEDGSLTPVFKVEPKMIQFVTSRPIGLSNNGGLFFVTYSLRNIPFSEKRALVAYQKPVYMIEDFKDFDVSNEDAINLIPEVIDLEWSHSSWEIEELGETLEMQKEREKLLPKEVTLTLRLGEGEHSYITQITIPLMVASKKPSKDKTKT